MLTSMQFKPAVTEQDFNYSVTYKIDGETKTFTFELSYDRGSGYIYFGMNYAARIEDGTGAQGIRYGRYYTRSMDATMIADHSIEK